MNAPINFTFHEKQMRVVMIDADPWWVAADLCALLGLRNTTQAVGRLDEDQVTLCLIEGASNGKPVNVVCESGMWMLVLRSDKPEAEELRRWLTREVLPALRKTGRYEMPGHEPPPMQAMDMDPIRMQAGANVVRLGLRLYGLNAARSLWLQVGLPPVAPDSEAVIDIDPLAQPLLAHLANRAETTINDAAADMGIANPDWTTRQRIARMLRMWGWENRTEKHDGKARRVYRRPTAIMAEARA